VLLDWSEEEIKIVLDGLDRGIKKKRD